MALRWSISQSPGRIVLLSIIGIIALGTLLLALPAAQEIPHAFIDLFFTATSATCVTGLLTIPLTEFTLFGKSIILLLMQIGGLGLITMTVFLISLFFQVGIKTHLIAGQILELDSWQNSKRIIKFIILLAFTTELIGTILLWFTLPASNDLPPFFAALFHAVSSFCSAGFSIFPDNMLVVRHNAPFLIITIALLLVGEMGFITWHELASAARALWRRRWFKLSLHTKIVLYCSLLIITGAAVALWFLERHNALAHESTGYAVLNTLFNAISYRSCGFSTLPFANLQCATFILVMVIAFIGSSPGSTGSGIKTTSFALIVATIKSIMSGRNVIELCGRRIAHEQIFKVLVIFSLAISWIILTTFILLLTEYDPHCSLLAILFEAVSAFANLGLSLNLTPLLSTAGKTVVILSMIIGRIGALTLILAIKPRHDTVEFQYPEERVMLS